MKLEELIKDEIRTKGRITFKRFMELALYHPELGYYSRGPKIGKKGDFYTSVSVGSIFGRTLAKALKEMLELSGSDTIVELGAGEGTLAGDILSSLGDDVKYIIVEKSPAFVKRQKEALKAFKNVSWIDEPQNLPPLSGVIFSNELFDALPVHLVEKKGRLFEVYVSLKGENFCEILDEPSTEKIYEYFERLNVKLADDFRTEVNLEGAKLIKLLGEKLYRGFVVTIDYGYPSHELYMDYRNRGTLVCYYRHKVNDNPYQHIGEQDITAHVNFSALAAYGKDAGLEVCGFTNQANFLIDAGILEEASSPDEILKAKTLILPESGMGEVFKVLIQHKGFDEKPRLSCLKNAPRRGSYEL